MQKSTKRLAVAKSLFPLDYDKNNTMPGYPEWRKYIRSEVMKMEHCRTFTTGAISVVVMPVEHLDALLKKESLRLQAEAQLERVRA